MIKTKRPPHLKAPGVKRFASPVRPRPCPRPTGGAFGKGGDGDDEPLLEEESEEEEHAEEDAGRPLKFTSLRVLVWVNFGLVFLLSTFFLIYVVTRPNYVVSQPQRVETKEKDLPLVKREESLPFTLIPHSESNGKWMRLPHRISAAHQQQLLYVNACCQKDNVFMCLHDVSLFEKDAKIRIRNAQMVGATCRLVWH